MINETEVFERFHSAFDAQPSPGAAQRLRSALLERADASPRRSSVKRGFRISLRVAAAMTLVVVAIATSGVFLALHRTAIRPGPALTPVNHALARSTWGMVSRTVGWEQTSWFDQNGLSHILRTTDGGTHWKDVSPPDSLVGLIQPFAQASYILDGDHVWTATISWRSGPYELIVLRTADGGKSWTKGSPIVGVSATSLYSAPYFLDADHGWLLLRELTTAPNTNAGDALYRTSDGGLSWSQVVVNLVTDLANCRWDNVAFASSTNGWLSVACPSGGFGAVSQLLVTHDGGATWSPQALPNPAVPGSQFVSSIPTVLDHDTAWVRVVYSDPTTGGAVLMTSNAGRTWTWRPLPGQKQSAVAFIDAMNGWVVDGAGALYRTESGGLTWELVRTSLTSNWSPDQLGDFYFVDPQDGFATFSVTTPQYLNKTTDSGKTWSVVGPMPPRGY